MSNKKNKDVWVWNSYSTLDHRNSIPIYVEENSVRLRNRYLAFIHDLGQTIIGKKRLIDHFELKPGFSFWPMSLLAEKSFGKSPYVMDCLKLISLEEILKVEKLKTLTILGVNDYKVAIAIKKLCYNLDVCVSLDGDWAKSKTGWRAKDIYYHLPHPIQAVISFLNHLVQRWSLRNTRPTSWFSGKDSIFFKSYFVHLDDCSYKDGHFYSRQWEFLPKVIHEEGIRSNWLHHFLFSKVIPDTRTGIDWLERFNRNSKSEGTHSFLDSYLSIVIILRTTIVWLKVLWKSFFMSKLERVFRPVNSSANLWPLLKDDWYRSFRGSYAIQNALNVELLDVMLGSLPKQSLGLYLYEGQGWESAFIHMWRKHKHGKLIAVSHSTVRFWDLRNFSDIRTFDEKSTLIPQPDFIAVNGPVAKKVFGEMGIPNERILEVEALRYLNLSGLASKRKNITNQGKKSKLRLLLLGDIMTSYTQIMMKTMQDLPKNIREEFDILVKPHPANPIKKSDYPLINFSVITKSLHEILDQCDLVYGANPTSANLDAYIAGLRIIIHLDGESLNLSPLRGVKEVSFVSDYKELTIALKNSIVVENESANDFFWLDNRLPKWRNIIEKYSGK
jgi:surface carbohydrate biosynthesis protein (TIGR04326 family)